jgi:pyruvate dehydrogenase E1 component alpha subunit
MSDAGAYRTKEEQAIWNERDPINILRDRLVKAGEMTMEDFESLDKEIIDEIENDIIKFAEESPEPKVEDLDKYVLAENNPYVRGGAH